MDPLDETVDHYRRFGYAIVDGLLPLDLVDEALHGVDRHHAGERDVELPRGLGFLDWRPGDPAGVKINDYASIQNHEIRSLVQHKPIAAMASLLSGSTTIRLFHDQIIQKDPAPEAAETTIGFHTDRAYWHTCSSDEMLTAWIPLLPCTAESGPIAVIPGSHRWDGNDDLAGFFNQDESSSLAEVATPGETQHAIPLVIQPGQVSFHHCRTVHGSRPNKTEIPRCAITVHFQDAANAYVAPLEGSRRSVHVNDLLCRRDESGLPDYSDPFVSPVLFQGSLEDARRVVLGARRENVK